MSSSYLMYNYIMCGIHAQLFPSLRYKKRGVLENGGRHPDGPTHLSPELVTLRRGVALSLPHSHVFESNQRRPCYTVVLQLPTPSVPTPSFTPASRPFIVYRAQILVFLLVAIGISISDTDSALVFPLIFVLQRYINANIDPVISESLPIQTILFIARIRVDPLFIIIVISADITPPPPRPIRRIRRQVSPLPCRDARRGRPAWNGRQGVREALLPAHFGSLVALHAVGSVVERPARGNFRSGVR
ncbi:hypothetical protein BDN71DRAFT_1308528 [Pleurotus eryngii]|uniref:Uncharacterized protein n=1 Tax=Pleurotus eryngii TaxID=5323 RepID=A0A9P5ZPZ6_PLEER|nr:hypothetical protein BDN71DRAFT_1308528 [Pleurotus eryngii]